MNKWGAISFAVAVSAFGACSASDTVVSVNINSTSEVGDPRVLAITITQEGQSPVAKEFEPPKNPTDGGMTIKPMFFERIMLPSAWESGPATLKVEAKNASGTYVTAETEFRVRAEGAVAAFITLGEEPMPEPPDAGAADGGGEDTEDGGG